MTTFTKHLPVFDVYDGAGSNQTLLGTIEQVPASSPATFRFNPVGGVTLSDPTVLRAIATRLEALNQNPPT